MMNRSADNDQSKRRFSAIIRKLVPMVIIAGAVLGVIVLFVVLPKKNKTPRAWNTSVGSYTLSYAPKKKEDKKTAPPPPISVRVQVVEPRPIVEDAFSIPGAVEPNRIVKVAAEVSACVEGYAGRKDSMGPDGQLIRGPASAGTVKEGDLVRKAQPILYLNTDLLVAQRDQAKAEYDFQQKESVRIKSLYEEELATQMEIDQVLLRYDVAKAALKLAAANLQRAVILAPIEGVLNRLPVQVGEYVAPGVVVAEIVDMDTVKIVLYVPERDIGYLKVGEEIKFVYDLAAPKNISGRITYISELADESTRTTRVELSVDNRRRNLRSGQIVQGHVVRRRLKDVIMIPLRAVIPLEKGYVVYVEEEGRAKRREVQLDRTLLKGHHIGIRGGLKKGDRLIVQGQRLVGPGQKVQVTEDVPETAPKVGGAGKETRPANDP